MERIVLENGAKITDNQRNVLLNRLHRPLFWVGEHVPREIEMEGKNVKLHEIIWEIINKTSFSTKDIENIELFLSLLREKEHEYERSLEHNYISYEEARNLFSQTAGIMRAIMDLVKIEEETKRKNVQDTKHICEGVEEKEWEHFVKDIRKDKNREK
nr:DUF5788 family protein [uncultured Methanomethylovorans sp.]